MAQTVKGVVARKVNEPVTIENIVVPDAGPGEQLVKIRRPFERTVRVADTTTEQFDQVFALPDIRRIVQRLALRIGLRRVQPFRGPDFLEFVQWIVWRGTTGQHGQKEYHREPGN